MVVREPESASLINALLRWPILTSAELVRTEAIRAIRRSGSQREVIAARKLFRNLSMVRLDQGILERAAELDPISLRSLDAIHVATALEIGSELGKFYCYDIRLKEAAEAQGLNVESPQ